MTKPILSLNEQKWCPKRLDGFGIWRMIFAENIVLISEENIILQNYFYEMEGEGVEK